jgi:hypothetical protein
MYSDNQRYSSQYGDDWDYREKREFCEVCDRNLEVDNILGAAYRFIEGLGYVCLTCFMKEVESREAS